MAEKQHGFLFKVLIFTLVILALGLIISWFFLGKGGGPPSIFDDYQGLLIG